MDATTIEDPCLQKKTMKLAKLSVQSAYKNSNTNPNPVASLTKSPYSTQLIATFKGQTPATTDSTVPVYTQPCGSTNGVLTAEGPCLIQ